jgi:SAM-dependent methyltransferase
MITGYLRIPWIELDGWRILVVEPPGFPNAFCQLARFKGIFFPNIHPHKVVESQPRSITRQLNNLIHMLRKLFFHIWYFKDPPWDTNQTPPELYDFIETTPPGRALDLGCGTGTNVITLIKNGWQATGVDFIPKAIRAAQRKALKAGVSADFQVGDVTQLKGIQGQFDLVLDIGCYQSLDPVGRVKYRERINQLLKPGGAYMIYLFFKSDDVASGSGATEADLKPFSGFLTLKRREDGSERGLRKSSWLTYQKPIN